MARPLTSIATMTAGALALLAIGACSRQPDPSTQEVVTSRSEGKAIPDPRRGSFKKSEPCKFEYTTPPETNTAAPSRP